MGWLRCACLAVTVFVGTIVPGQVASADTQYEPGEGVARASKFGEFPVHFGGEEVAGFPLVAVLGGRNLRKTTWSFIYGDCDPPAGEGGCPSPLEIQTASTCTRYRDVYPGEQTSFRFRGAEASRNAGADFEIYTGRVTISIFGEPELVRSAARIVRPVAHEDPERLRPPVEGSLTGDLRCQPPPSEFPF
jgi:hypothetical protein